MTSRRRAFTLIELLVVIAVIAILAGLVLAVIGYVRENAKVNKTRVIINGAQVGISTTAMRTNVNISPVEHPLANTLASVATPRPLFLRGEAVAGLSVGDAVAAAGQALMAAVPASVASSELPRLLLPTDRYCGGANDLDTDSPMLYGYDRQYVRVIGTAYGLHSVRRLPAISPQNDRNRDGVLDNPPYVENPGTGVAYPGTLDEAPGDLANTTALELEQKKLFDYVFGPEVQSELVALDGIRTADASGGAGIASALICANRLRSWGDTLSAWDEQVSRLKGAPIVRDGATWRMYRLRGPALYDAWGHEILCYIASNGSLVFESAGRDGVFRWHPGGDRVYQTSATAGTASGDDKDGSRDNVATGLK